MIKQRKSQRRRRFDIEKPQRENRRAFDDPDSRRRGRNRPAERGKPLNGLPGCEWDARKCARGQKRIRRHTTSSGLRSLEHC